MNSFWSCGLPGKCFKVGDESQAVGLVTNSMSSSNHFFIFTTAWIRLRYLVLKMFGDWCLRFCFWIFSSGGTLNFRDPTFTPYSSKLLIPYKMNDWNIHWTWSQFFCWYPKVSANLPHHIFLSIFLAIFFGLNLWAHQSSIAGVLPPVLCAPFDDPDDFDDIAAGVPMLHGLRRRRPCSNNCCVLDEYWRIDVCNCEKSLKFLLLGFEWIWHFLLIPVVQVL